MGRVLDPEYPGHAATRLKREKTRLNREKTRLKRESGRLKRVKLLEAQVRADRAFS